MIRNMNSAMEQAFRSKLEVLLGDRDPASQQRALRHGELRKALESSVLSNVVARIIEGGVGKSIKKLQSELGQITTNQSFVASYLISDQIVGQERIEAAPLSIANVQLSGFTRGAFSVSYNAFADNLHRFNSFGAAALYINGTEASRVRFGLRAAAPDASMVDTRFCIPLTLPGIFAGTASSFTIEVRAWTSDPDAPGTTTGGFFLRGGRIVVGGGVG